MTFSQAQLHAAESFISKNPPQDYPQDFMIPREVWLVAAAMQEERERCAKHANRLLDGYDAGDDGFGVEEAIRSGRTAK